MNYREINDYELLYLIKENDEVAYNNMIKKYQPIIYKKAVNFKYYAQSFGLDFDDLIQEGNIALMEAIKFYKEDKGFLFYTFFLTCLNRKIMSCFDKYKRSKYIPVQLIDNLFSDDENFSLIEHIEDNKQKDPYLIIDDNILIDFCIVFKNQLNEDLSSVFELRFNGFSYKEISELLNLTIKQVDNKMIKIRKSFLKLYNREVL